MDRIEVSLHGDRYHLHGIVVVRESEPAVRLVMMRLLDAKQAMFCFNELSKEDEVSTSCIRRLKKSLLTHSHLFRRRELIYPSHVLRMSYRQ